MKKLIFALLIVAALLVVVMPAAAQGPAPVMIQTRDRGPKPIYVVKAGTNEDPFGGLPIQTSSGLGAASIFGTGGPGVFLIPGGVPSNKSGDGTTPRKSIYIGGAWDKDGGELPTCATVKIPAGSSRWFKMDTWKDFQLQVWVDDELNDATTPSGSAVFGAGDYYMLGLAPGSAWAVNAASSKGAIPEDGWVGPYTEGFVMAILDPDNMRPNYAFPPPNATLYTTNGDRDKNNLSTADILGSQSIHGYGQYNWAQPSHLLWYDGNNWAGWVHAKVTNQMIWDGTVSVCSYRAKGG